MDDPRLILPDNSLCASCQHMFMCVSYKSRKRGTNEVSYTCKCLAANLTLQVNYFHGVAKCTAYNRDRRPSNA